MAFIGTSGLNNLICFRILFRTARFDRESNYVCMKVYMYVCMYVCRLCGGWWGVGKQRFACVCMYGLVVCIHVLYTQPRH